MMRLGFSLAIRATIRVKIKGFVGSVFFYK